MRGGGFFIELGLSGCGCNTGILRMKHNFAADESKRIFGVGEVMEALSGVLGELRRVCGWEARECQHEMMEALAAGMCGPGAAVVEAGTGTGKTLAVLCVALAMSRVSGRRCVVSTRTLGLMDGMLNNDLPWLSSALGGISYAGVKGRGNYACLRSLADLEGEFLKCGTREGAWEYAKAARFVLESRQCDMGEGGALFAPSLFGERSCAKCEWRGDCPRDVAEVSWGGAEIVVANHTRLLMEPSILDGAAGLFVDEAHTWLDAMAGAFGWEVSLDALAERGGRMAELLEWAGGWLGAREVRARTVGSESGDRLLSGLKSPSPALRRVAEWLGCDDGAMAYWAERRKGGIFLCAGLADCAETSRREILSRTAASYVSATLSSASRGFDAFLEANGIEAAVARRVESPFDYGRQMVLHMCKSLPPPNLDDAGYVDGACRAVLHYATHYGGRTFVLFTSFAALETFAARLGPRLASRGISILRQERDGDAWSLAEEFRKRGGRGVALFGAGSFWTGVDVAGDALSCVVVTRLPFPSPSDPLEAARCERARDGEGGAFGYLLDTAVARFRQGVGRLVRTATDVGVVAVLDSRMADARYGQAFLDALPECRTQVF